jgi:hypothetical protein
MAPAPIDPFNDAIRRAGNRSRRHWRQQTPFVPPGQAKREVPFVPPGRATFPDIGQAGNINAPAEIGASGEAATPAIPAVPGASGEAATPAIPAVPASAPPPGMVPQAPVPSPMAAPNVGQGQSLTIHPPGVPADRNQYNYEPQADGSWRVYPPGVSAPQHTLSASLPRAASTGDYRRLSSAFSSMGGQPPAPVATGPGTPSPTGF